MLCEYTLQTGRQGFYNVTARVCEAVEACGVTDGACLVYCPHTTAGITVNENSDPDVVSDMLLGLERAYPTGRSFATRRATPPPISGRARWARGCCSRSKTGGRCSACGRRSTSASSTARAPGGSM